jgi:arylsulfatase A-like enzyme
VVFLSDHGYHLADHGLWQKMSLFEKSARVPLVIAAPGARGNGRAASGVVELLDLYRTLADLAGLTPAAEIEGQSLRPMLDDPRATVKQRAFTKVRDGYAVRTARWRYIEWSAGEAGRQLYDMERDRTEMNDLAAKQPKLVESLAKKWDAWASENYVTPMPLNYRVNYLRQR